MASHGAQSIENAQSPGTLLLFAPCWADQRSYLAQSYDRLASSATRSA